MEALTPLPSNVFFIIFAMGVFSNLVLSPREDNYISSNGNNLYNGWVDFRVFFILDLCSEGKNENNSNIWNFILSSTACTCK